MKGNVIGFDPDTNTGAISGHDGQRYDFAAADWHSTRRPQHGDQIDFVPDGARATQIYLLEPEYVAPNPVQFLFSPRGRISRSQYWLRYVLPVAAIGLVLQIAIVASGEDKPVGKVFEAISNIFLLVTLWPGIAILVKRIHDRDKPGWLVFVLYVPLAIFLVAAAGTLIALIAEVEAALFAIVATAILATVVLGICIWFFVEFGCLRGTIGANRYGPDPVRSP